MTFLRVSLRPHLSTRTTPTTLVPAASLFARAKITYRQQLPPADRTLPIPTPRGKEASIPPYPLGPRLLYKQSNIGLYGFQRIRFGNHVSTRKHGFIEYDTKAKRKWWPNVQGKRLWSEALGCFIRTRITTRVLRTVDKEGGIDNYLLGEKANRIKELGPWGWRLRWRIMQTEMAKQRFADMRERMGLPPKLDVQKEAGGLAVEMNGVEAGDMAEGTDRRLESKDASPLVLGDSAEEAAEEASTKKNRHTSKKITESRRS